MNDGILNSLPTQHSNDPARPSVAVVILNWNKPRQTRHCLQVSQRNTNVPAHWIVVDNGSTEPMEHLGAGVTLIRNTENRGFAGGVNTGLRRAFEDGAKHVWLLNNDAEPLSGALDALVAAADADPSIGLASAVILDSSAQDTVVFHGGIWNNGDYRVTTDADEYEAWSAANPNRIWLTGTALLVSRRLVERIGYFDEAMFSYWEDNDYSRRSASAGFRNVVIPAARVRHETDQPGCRPSRSPYYYYYMARNELILLRKTGDLAFRPLYWALRRSAGMYANLKSFPTLRHAVRRGVIDGLLARGGPYAG